MKTFGGVAAMAAGVVLLAGCGDDSVGSSAPTSEEGTRIERAADECSLHFRVRDDGASITLDTEGEEDSPADQTTLTGVACVLEELETPDYVIQHMDSTRALDGMQSEEWDGLEARWSYHPDTGMNLTVIERL